MVGDGSLRGKVVLITGGRRVGSALARMLASRGANLAMTYHSSREAIERVITEVQATGVEGMSVAADLSNAEAARSRGDRGRPAVWPSGCPGEHGQRLSANSVPRRWSRAILTG